MLVSDVRVLLDIPDGFARSLIPEGQDSARAALEAWGVGAYRLRRLSAYQLRTLLCIPSRWDLHALLKKHQLAMYSLDDFEQDLATNQDLTKKHQS